MMNALPCPRTGAAPFTLPEIVAGLSPLVDLAGTTDRPVARAVLQALLREMAAGRDASP